MNILEEKLKNANLTKTQQKIADYFFKNIEKIGNLSSIEVAKEIGVSDASIIRFSRTIGYSGFLDLKNDIYRHLAQNATSRLSELELTKRYDINSQKYKDENLTSEYIEMMNYNINKSLFQNSQEKYDKVVDIISNSKSKYVVGFRGCKGVSAHFGRLLNIIINGVTTISNNENESIGIVQDITSEDVLIMFVFARYYKIDMLLVNMAYKRKAKIIIITDSMTAPVVKYSDIVLTVETDHMSFFNSSLGANIVSEYLLTLITRNNSYLYRQRALELDNFTTDFRLK